MSKISILFFRIISLISLTLFLIFVVFKKEQRKPVWSSTSEILVYDKNQTNNSFIVLNIDSTEIEGNIYIQEFEIWNAGNKEIRKEDVRVPIGFVFNRGSFLIRDSIIEQIASAPNNFKIVKVKDSLQLQWKYFDPGDGVKVKLIFTSKKGIFPKLEGKVIGNSVRELKANKDNFQTIGIISLFISLLIWAPLFLGVADKIYALYTRYIPKYAPQLISISIGLSLVIIFFIVFFLLQLGYSSNYSPFVDYSSILKSNMQIEF